MSDTDLKLGKLPKVEDPRTLPMARYLTLDALPTPPVTVDVSNIGGTPWGMLANNSHGDCTAAAAAHLEMIFTFQATGTARTYTDQETLDFYGLINGGQDHGAVELDALNAWRTTGIGGRKLHAFAEVQHGNLAMVKTAMWLFSGLYVGAAMPVSAQAPGTWDVVAGPQGIAGSWGGHALAVAGFSPAGVTFVTWGRLQLATWGWWSNYIDECYVALPEDFEALPVGKALWNGFNAQQLEVDLSQLA